MRSLFYSGTEILPVHLPDGSQLILPPDVRPGVPDVRDAVIRALEQPVDGKPIDERVNERSRVLLVFDPPAFPVPPLRVDPRLAAVEAILSCLDDRGLPLQNVSLLCASGLTRQFRSTEIARVAGVPALASHEAHCHDCEAIDQLARLGATPEGEEVEVNAALTRADVVITLSLAQAPVQGGWTTLMPGVASTASARAFLTAQNLAYGPGAFDPASGFQQAIRRAGTVISQKVDLLHVELALDTRLWFKPVIDLLRQGEVPAPIVAWDRIPEPIRARASRLFHSEYQTLGAAAGSVDAAHEAVCRLLRARTYTEVDQQTDVVVLGVPAVAPHTLNSYDNPVLAVTSAFGNILAWHTGKPLLRKGGSVVLLSPLPLRFDTPTHLPFQGFFEKVLPETRDPSEMARHWETLFAGRPEYVSAYRRRHAYHGLQPFHAWYQAWNALSQVGHVFVVGADPKVAQRFGFEAVSNVEVAIQAAREHAGKDARIAAPVLPPAFGIAVR